MPPPQSPSNTSNEQFSKTHFLLPAQFPPNHLHHPHVQIAGSSLGLSQPHRKSHPMPLPQTSKINEITNPNFLSQINTTTPPNGANPSPKPHIILFLTQALGRARTKRGAQRRQIFSAEIFFFTTTMSFSDFSKVESLKSLNDFLTDKSYVDGYVSP